MRCCEGCTLRETDKEHTHTHTHGLGKIANLFAAAPPPPQNPWKYGCARGDLKVRVHARSWRLSEMHDPVFKVYGSWRGRAMVGFQLVFENF